jgi:hypothetical protein
MFIKMTRRQFAASMSATALAPSLARAAAPNDVAILRSAYGQLHPGLYRYSTPDETNVRFDALERAFGEAGSDAARYIVLSRFLATIRCGHTYANFFNQSKAIGAELFSGKDRLPFYFRWLGNRLIVTKDFSGDLAPGTEVTAIEGRAVSEILRGLLAVARADGSNDDKRRSLMSVKGSDSIESFDVFYPLIFGSRDSYRLALRDTDGTSREQAIAAISLDERRAENPSVRDKSSGLPIWTFETRGKVGILTMPDWSLYDSKWDWKAWLDARFADIDGQKLTGLVIDLRANEGGLDCGNEVIARLIDAPTSARSMRRLVRYRRVPDDLVPYLDTWDPSFRDWGADAQSYDARFYTLSDKDSSGADANIIQPKGPRFKGKLAVLIGPENSSATFQFAQLVQTAKLGVLVGENTGGNQRGINGGAFFFLRLPQSGLEADLPLIGTFPLTPKPDRGLSPDIAAPQTQEAIAAGYDTAMAKAMSAVAA